MQTADCLWIVPQPATQTEENSDIPGILGIVLSFVALQSNTIAILCDNNVAWATSDNAAVQWELCDDLQACAGEGGGGSSI